MRCCENFVGLIWVFIYHQWCIAIYIISAGDIYLSPFLTLYISFPLSLGCPIDIRNIIQGDITKAIECYTSALECCAKDDDDISLTTSSTLLSNRAMAHLKSAELPLSSSDSTTSSNDEQQQQIQNVQNSLQNCIDDCTLALQQLDSTPNSTTSNTKEEEESKLNLRTKLLYRNAKALVTLANLPSSLSPSNSTSSNSTSSMSNSTKEKKLNESAKLLLQLLQLQPANKEASNLLNQVREIHSSMNSGSSGSSGSSRVGKALDYLNILTSNNNKQDESKLNNTELPKDEKGKEITILDCLHILQGSLSDDIPSTSNDIGKYEGGVQLLLQIARFGIPPPTSSIEGEEREDKNTQCRLASLHILSACCSTDTFILQYAKRNILSPNLLAQIVEEEASSLFSSGSSNKWTREGAADIAVATIALLVRLIVHYDHYEIIKHFTPKILEDGSIEELNDQQKKKLQQMQIPEVDGSVICRVAIAAFLWGTNDRSGSSSNEGENIDTRPPRAALDLLSAWTASDLDALDAASDACFTPTSSDSSSNSQSKKKKASQHFLSPEDIRRMKPRQVSAHRKREGEFTRSNLSRAIEHISTFCNDQSGGLNSMLICASTTIDHRLRREVGLQIGRMMSVYVENDDVKKLIYRELGCSDWTVGKEEEEKGENVGQQEMSTLTIEELDDDEEEGKEMDDSSEESKLLSMMKRGQLTASLIMGKPDVGTWALKYGWSNGQGVEELKQLISSNNSCAMSIASELVSAASSVESSRPLLATLVQEGTLEDLLIHPDADVRSGAASCAAKIGLASKALSSDDGEVMGLLDVAIELLFEEDEWLDDDDNKSSSKSKVEALTKKVPPSRKASEESTSMDRGIEVLAYLVSKTFVKEKVVGGYKPEGSPADRKTALERLVEIACAPSSGDAQLSYGLASVFNLLAVSIETLRKEAFIGKEITREQYDQLQALGKTEEEKEAEAKKDEKEGDNPASVSERIRKLASSNVPRAMVKLLEGSSSDTTQDKLLEGMCRMASEPTVRGLMIQQGCLTTCLQLDKGVSV